MGENRDNGCSRGCNGGFIRLRLDAACHIHQQVPMAQGRRQAQVRRAFWGNGHSGSGHVTNFTQQDVGGVRPRNPDTR